MTSNVDMSLDDIIKSNKNFKNRRMAGGKFNNPKYSQNNKYVRGVDKYLSRGGITRSPYTRVNG